MAVGFRHGPGGINPLAVRIVGGTTQPSAAAENTIWVNTSTAISDWVFQASRPTQNNTAGRVWIQTGTQSDAAFNALKKNGIYLYPLAAMQYVSGAWVEKTAKSYLDGQWVDWEKELAVSLSASAWAAKQFAGDGGSIRTESGALYLESSSISTGGGMTYPPGFTTTYQTSLDLSDYATMSVNMTLEKTENQEISLQISGLADYSDSSVSATAAITPTLGRATYTLDVSSVSSGYPCIRWYDRTGDGTIIVHSVKFNG